MESIYKLMGVTVQRKGRERELERETYRIKTGSPSGQIDVFEKATRGEN